MEGDELIVSGSKATGLIIHDPSTLEQTSVICPGRSSGEGVSCLGLSRRYFRVCDQILIGVGMTYGRACLFGTSEEHNSGIKQLTAFQPHRKQVTSISFLIDHSPKFLTTSMDGNLAIHMFPFKWDSNGGRELIEVRQQAMTKQRLPNREMFRTSSGTWKHIGRWKPIPILYGTVAKSKCLAFTADVSGCVSAWSILEETRIGHGQPAPGNEMVSLEVNQGTESVLIAGSSDGRLFLYEINGIEERWRARLPRSKNSSEVDTMEPFKTIHLGGNPGRVCSITISRNNTIVISTENGGVRVLGREQIPEAFPAIPAMQSQELQGPNVAVTTEGVSRGFSVLDILNSPSENKVVYPPGSNLTEEPQNSRMIRAQLCNNRMFIATDKSLTCGNPHGTDTKAYYFNSTLHLRDIAIAEAEPNRHNRNLSL